MIEQGNQEPTVEQMRQGIAAYQGTGAEIGRPRSMALLAQALDQLNRTAEGITVLEEALEIANRTGELYYQAELYRLKGELLLKQSRSGSADKKSMALVKACFDKSLKIAKRQQAKSWQLRAAMSMARLYKEQCSREEAWQLLAPVYDSFTEGFETPDLLEAHALLQELSEPSTDYAHSKEKFITRNRGS